ncbi:MAG TPA: GNAT family N-acetyltransferase [Solirubrobacterales bacterium]|nr:GNAT family N-acetyltransferase [Solirubrobacterales bacterium]
MGQRVDDAELRRRAISGLRDEVEAFGSGHPDSRLIEREGLLASLTPVSPQRSLFNSVYYEDAGALRAELDSLQGVYDEAGIAAWTVWVADEDRETAELLAARGHSLDAEPRAMALDLADLATLPPTPEGIESRPGDAATAAELNDCAYGYGPDAFRAALAGETSIGWHAAHSEGEPVSVVGMIEVGDDCCVTGVATPPEQRGRGIASWLLCTTLAAARERGMRTASLQATKAGAPIYERLGFRDLGHIEMWELRK